MGCKKILQDKEAANIDFIPDYRYSSISEIRSISRKPWHEDDIRDEIEQSTVKFNCRIKKEYKRGNRRNNLIMITI